MLESVCFFIYPVTFDISGFVLFLVNCINQQDAFNHKYCQFFLEQKVKKVNMTVTEEGRVFDVTSNPNTNCPLFEIKLIFQFERKKDVFKVL